MKFKSIFLTILFCITGTVLLQAVELAKIFSDNMVIQQNKDIHVWGKAQPNENVRISFLKQVQKTTADSQGNWSVRLQAVSASDKPSTMTIQGKKEKITLKNILIGEVWLASGQSNMEYSMNNHLHYAKAKKGDPDFLSKAFRAKQDPRLRVIYIERKLSPELPTSGWAMPDSAGLTNISAAAYFFAQKLIQELNVPVGIISSSWGGTPIENWTPECAYTSDKELSKRLKNNKLDGTEVEMRFDAMIRPIAPFSLAGFLWYQGETNLMNGDRGSYTAKQKALVDSWRNTWNDPDLPFYYVQIAPFKYSVRRNDRTAQSWETLPLFWEAQTRYMDVDANAGMVVTTDLVDKITDIHPSYKWIVGERLANWALAKTYGKTEVVYSGPVCKSIHIQGDQAILEFDHLADGLKTTSQDGSLSWFQVGVEDEKFYNAKATIENNTVVLTIDKKVQSRPITVRFAWDEEAMPDLFNSAGLPAVPFRITEK